MCGFRQDAVVIGRSISAEDLNAFALEIRDWSTDAPASTFWMIENGMTAYFENNAAAHGPEFDTNHRSGIAWKDGGP